MLRAMEFMGAKKTNCRPSVQLHVSWKYARSHVSSCDLPHRTPEGRARDIANLPQSASVCDTPVPEVLLTNAALVSDAENPRLLRVRHDAIVQTQTADSLSPQNVSFPTAFDIQTCVAQILVKRCKSARENVSIKSRALLRFLCAPKHCVLRAAWPRMF